MSHALVNFTKFKVNKTKGSKIYSKISKDCKDGKVFKTSTMVTAMIVKFSYDLVNETQVLVFFTNKF